MNMNVGGEISPEAAQLAHAVTPCGWHGTVIDEALRKAKADAWDEGRRAALSDERDGGADRPNPYRLRA